MDKWVNRLIQTSQGFIYPMGRHTSFIIWLHFSQCLVRLARDEVIWSRSQVQLSRPSLVYTLSKFEMFSFIQNFSDKYLSNLASWIYELVNCIFGLIELVLHASFLWMLYGISAVYITTLVKIIMFFLSLLRIEIKSLPNTARAKQAPYMLCILGMEHPEVAVGKKNGLPLLAHRLS